MYKMTVEKKNMNKAKKYFSQCDPDLPQSNTCFGEDPYGTNKLFKTIQSLVDLEYVTYGENEFKFTTSGMEYLHNKFEELLADFKGNEFYIPYNGLTTNMESNYKLRKGKDIIDQFERANTQFGDYRYKKFNNSAMVMLIREHMESNMP